MEHFPLLSPLQLPPRRSSPTRLGLALSLPKGFLPHLEPISPAASPWEAFAVNARGQDGPGASATPVGAVTVSSGKSVCRVQKEGEVIT